MQARGFIVANQSNIPSHVVVLGKKIKIKRHKKLVDTTKRELFGLFDSDTMTIHLSRSPLHSEKSTLLHEILHAIMFITGQNEILEFEQEEAIVRAIENGLFPLVDLVW